MSPAQRGSPDAPAGPREHRRHPGALLPLVAIPPLPDDLEQREGTGVVGVGIDVASVVEVERSITTFGDAYLQRLFTPHELQTCGTSAQRLAARFAAKEAAFKALRLDDGHPPWKAIEVHRHAGGWCSLRLSDRVRTLCTTRGVAELLVSLTHEDDVAAAVVVALGAAGSLPSAPQAPGN